MKRLLAVLVAAAALTVVTPSSAEAHTISSGTTAAICSYIRPPVGGWAIVGARSFHYGTAHVTQCWYRSGSLTRCKQYTWNVPSPVATDYPPIGGPVGGRCW